MRADDGGERDGLVRGQGLAFGLFLAGLCGGRFLGRSFFGRSFGGGFLSRRFFCSRGLLGRGFGPTLVALISDNFYDGPQALGFALNTAAAVLMALALVMSLLLLRRARRPALSRG